MKRPDITTAMAVYEGRIILGYLKQVDGGFHAWSATDTPLGTFPTREAALAAIKPTAQEAPALAR
ncbi:MAG: hypothetical protein WBA66_13845 [Xanthobacteraceae bacterium]